MQEPSLTDYVAGLYGPVDDLLRELPKEAAEAGLPAIHIPDEIGRLLQVLIVTSGTKRILELGTLFGYSSIWMARVLPEGGTILSLEFEPKHAEIARKNHTRAGVQDKVEVRVGPALDSLPGLSSQTFDLVFIDADKVNYTNYLEWALRLSRPGTLIIADNTWRGGGVIDGRDEAATAMHEFNCALTSNGKLLSTVIPTRDCADALIVAVVRE